MLLFGKKDRECTKKMYLDRIKGNDTDAMIHLGDMYMRFYNNIDKAIKFYKMAAENRNLYAMIKLGKIYSNRIDELVKELLPGDYLYNEEKYPKNEDKYLNDDGKKYFDKAIETFLLDKYLKNEKNIIQILKEHISENGIVHIINNFLVDITEKLELAYLYGKINKYDKRIIEIYKNFLNIPYHNKEITSAIIHNLAYCTDHGYGIEKNLIKAIVLYSKAGKMGHRGSLNNLSLIMYDLRKYDKYDRYEILIKAIEECDDEITLLLCAMIPEQTYIIKEIAEINLDCLKKHEKIILNHENNDYDNPYNPFYNYVLWDYKEYVLKKQVSFR